MNVFKIGVVESTSFLFYYLCSFFLQNAVMPMVQMAVPGPAGLFPPLHTDTVEHYYPLVDLRYLSTAQLFFLTMYFVLPEYTPPPPLR